MANLREHGFSKEAFDRILPDFTLYSEEKISREEAESRIVATMKSLHYGNAEYRAWWILTVARYLTWEEELPHTSDEKEQERRRMKKFLTTGDPTRARW